MGLIVIEVGILPVTGYFSIIEKHQSGCYNING